MKSLKAFLLAAFAVTALGLAGCGGSDQPAQPQKATDQEKAQRFERAKKRLPPDATDAKDEGNGWYSFRLARDGTTHKYLTVFSKTGGDQHVVSVTRMD